MSDYLVTDTELTSVANAIRTKGGTSANLSFPTGFVSAINDISTGGTSDFSTAQVTISNTSGSSAQLFITHFGYSYPQGNMLMPDYTIWGGATATLETVLYKGGEIATENTMWDTHTITVSGNITYSSGKIYIRGDGTITLS